MMTDVACEIFPRVNSAGHRFTEIAHTFREDGVECLALSRVWWEIDDTPHGRAAQNAAFIARQRKPYGDAHDRD
jgi:hypothetical protein